MFSLGARLVVGGASVVAFTFGAVGAQTRLRLRACPPAARLRMVSPSGSSSSRGHAAAGPRVPRRCPWRRARRCPGAGAAAPGAAPGGRAAAPGWRPCWRPRWRPRCGRTDPGLRRGRRQAWPRGDRPQRADEAVEGSLTCVREGARDPHAHRHHRRPLGQPDLRAVGDLHVEQRARHQLERQPQRPVQRDQQRPPRAVALQPRQSGLQAGISLHADPGRRRRGLDRH